MNEIGPHLAGIDQLRTMMEADRRPGIGETLDIRLIEVDDGRVMFEATPDVHLYNPLGTVHGGFAATMLDFACGYAVLSKMVPGQAFTTLELKVAYHKAMTKDTGTVRAEGRIVTFGRRAAFTEARLTDMAGKLYASATSSLLVIAA
ncbi:PaaI family thioesterase [Geobacter grbiciae]|uniref:PaaI family thioesterase n=1 Tax=Geobacter grbiciae TaxID=155042 RepID=UPI001C01705C|nr:PaaI family thioesterase [Geobacter grbiciae]